MKLSALVESEGYGFEVTPEPHTHPYLGEPAEAETFSVLMCQRDNGTKYLAAKVDSLDLVYSAAHEIAEDRFGHEHSVWVLSMQANLMARWIRAVDKE